MNNLIIIDDTICKDELREFINKYSMHIKLFLTEDDYDINLDDLIQRISSDLSNQKTVFIATKQDVLRIALKQILFLKYVDNKVEITLSTGETHELDKSLSYYKANFEQDNIIQINDQSLININSVKAFSLEQGNIILEGNYRFNVDEAYKNQTIKLLQSLEQNNNTSKKENKL